VSALDPDERLAIQLIATARRDGPNPIERARAYKRLMEWYGWSTGRLAKELSVAPSTISKALALLDLPGPVQDRVEQGSLNPAISDQITMFPPGDQAAVAERAVAEGLRRDDPQCMVWEEGVADRRRAEYRAGGFVFTIAGPVDDAAALRGALREVLRRLEDDEAA
jgi:ParB-like chromosome segregation protein Spo0J